MKVFISYNRNDRDHAEKLGKFLLGEGIDVWYDRWEITAGTSMTDKMDKGLKEVDAVIVLMSTSSMTSPWVREELKFAFQRRNSQDSFLLIPILLEDCEIHSLLMDYHYIDWREGRGEPTDELLIALKRIKSKPDFYSDTPEPKLELFKVICTYVIQGYRGKLVNISEQFSGMAKQELRIIDRQNYSAGYVETASCVGLQLERTTLNTAMEHWSIISDPPLPAGGNFSYELMNSVRDSFASTHQEITYSIDAPTNELVMIFDFSQASSVADLEMGHWVGRTRYQEPTPLLNEGSIFTWRKLVPRYKDTYELRFRWTT